MQTDGATPQTVQCGLACFQRRIPIAIIWQIICVTWFFNSTVLGVSYVLVCTLLGTTYQHHYRYYDCAR